ncbi:cupin domain-containing protein [Paracoccaceae bacterium]|nr:cupin domain-containing protein [Paracoccaceae bacterium]
MNTDEYKPGEQPIFPKVEDVGSRPWGKEEILVVVPGKYMLKKLTINKGSKGGLQYHRLKDECGVLISGKLLLRFDNGLGDLMEKIIQPGESFHFPPGVVHQEEALEDCVIIEGSTPHFNDRVRMEKYFGMSVTKGLPSTSIEEIVKK